MSDIRDDARDLTRSQNENAVFTLSKQLAFAAAAAATLTVDPTGTNNSLDFTAEEQGTDGNDITIKYVDPGVASASLAVSVSGSDITVSLATGAGTNEVQTITINATGGFFNLQFRDQLTGKLAYNATAAQVQAALEGLGTIGAGNVAVSGSAGGPYTVTFQGALAAQDVSAISADSNRLLPFKPRVNVKESVKGTGSVDEIQKVQVQGATRGTFTLTFSGQTTSALAYNVSAANMLTALQALSNWNDSAGAVTKSGSEYTVTFSGTGLTHTDQPLLTANVSGLKPSVGIVETTPGVAYAITSTAGQIITAIRASSAADALVSVANHAANDGTGVVTARSVASLTGGLDGNGTFAAQAALTTSLTGANNDLVFTAVPTGTDGNGIKVAYVDPGGATATLGVVVDSEERTITVNLGRAASAINTTAAALKAAVDATPAAAALVTVANAGADTGAGIVTALASTPLAGGGEGGIDLFTAHGDTLVAVTVSAGTSLTGASSTLEVGKAGATNALVPTTTATGLTAGKVADKTGVATGDAVTTPFYPVNDGETIKFTPKTANITGGTATVTAYYKRLTTSARLRAA